MAQTRRRTKHRGNAAGVIESRGRTGRRPTAVEKARDGSAGKRKARADRYERPPSWRTAFYKALAAAVVVVVLTVVLTRGTVEAIVLFPIVLALYWPMSYHTDAWIYKRHQRDKAKRAARKEALSR